MINFLKNIVSEIEKLDKSAKIAYWNLSVTGEERYAQEFEKWTVALRKLYSSKKDFDFLNGLDEVQDPVLARQITLLKYDFIENQIPQDLIEKIVKLETEIEALYTNFRATIDGKHFSNNDLKKILAESDDVVLREKAWKASKEIGVQVSEKVLALIALRNEAATIAGFSDYYTMRLHLQELEEGHLFDLLEQLEELTDDIWQKYKTTLEDELIDKFQTAKLMPWHYGDPFFQESPNRDIDFDKFYEGKDPVAISKSYFDSIGLPVDDILLRSDLFEREKKNQHAFCISIDRSLDVRILCNIRSDEYWMCTQLHELGHAVYDKFIDQNLPFLLRAPAHTSTTEASAMFFGRLSKNERFINLYAKPGSKFDNSQFASQFLIFARWVMVMVYFERDLYQKPTSDFNQLWWHYVERFQWIDRVPGRDLPDWASKLHLACAPVYYQNYLLGEMTASQLHHKIGDPFSKNVGEFLTEKLFALGAKYPWNETLEKATGEPLNPSYFVKELESLK